MTCHGLLTQRKYRIFTQDVDELRAKWLINHHGDDSTVALYYRVLEGVEDSPYLHDLYTYL
jgi:hypothetical protein